MAARSRFALRGKSQDSYLDLVRAFPLAAIRSEGHFAEAQEVMDGLLARGGMGPGEAMYLDALSDLVATYEDLRHAIEPASDADMLRHLMEAKGITQAELARASGIPRSSISEMLSGKKPFTRPVIRRLAAYFRIDASILAANFGNPPQSDGRGPSPR
ncbi:helix-turn-helix protein [Aquisphaera giovannonii]|uniref:Helix-turn-helix protein n=1 Tax=Aquisphaera giovannonii TaxID=406548 RepID=A0A5B9W3M6_9BACT|nr:helix-turn-helix transcriptional regulator [Aquisphaera giovannonii]QEH35192.1 helix-turn-helix protein [Aquisphaera giovannonii]